MVVIVSFADWIRLMMIAARCDTYLASFCAAVPRKPNAI
jgi:hypothetical protein